MILLFCPEFLVTSVLTFLSILSFSLMNHWDRFEKSIVNRENSKIIQDSKYSVVY